MKRAILVFCLISAVFVWAWPASAATPLGGLAVALSPAGNVLAAAGDNRVLYVLDAAEMQVVNRIWLGVDIVELSFNKNGGTLLAEDTDGSLHLIDAKSWKVLKSLPKAQQMTAAGGQDLVAGLNPDYNGHVVRFLAMTDLQEKGQIAFPKEEKVQAIGLSADGSRLAVLMESVADASEPKATQPPAGLKDMALEEFRLKNDGKTAVLKVYKAPSGEKLWEQKLYYSPSSNGCRLFFQGDKVVAVNYVNLNAVIGSDGAVGLFGLDNSYNYGLGFSTDQTILLSGGLAAGTFTRLDGLHKVTFQPDRLAGWPEYFKSFAVAGDGTAYGATSGYRLIKIKADGAFARSVPVY